MKRLFLFLTAVLSIAIIVPAQAQLKGNGIVAKKTFETEAFSSVDASGASNVILTQDEGYTVVVETDENLIDFVTVEVKNGKLSFGFSKTIKNFKTLNFYVTAPMFDAVNVSGASELKGSDRISGDHIKIAASGASEVSLNLDYNSCEVTLSGASEVTLNGNVKSNVVKISGASELYAKGLVTNSTVVDASGASECMVNALNNLTYQSFGASEVKFIKYPNMVIVKKSGNEEVVVTTNTTRTINRYSSSDTTTVSMGLFDVEVIDGDTTYVSVGRHTLVVSDNGDVKWERKKRTKFNGNWGGVDIGLNGYVTPDFNMDFDKPYDYLDLRMEKSINVNLNIYEQNIGLNKDKNIGLVTGIGMSINNYRFSNPTYLTPDSSEIMGYYMQGINVRKSKLTACYITVPLFIEFQTKHDRKSHQFHFAAGVIMNARISNHTKIYFDESDKEFNLVDPATGQVAYVDKSPNASGRNIVKDHSSFHMAPFRWDVSVRLGYGIINLYATYSLNTMFIKNRGPELYPFSAGITLVSW